MITTIIENLFKEKTMKRNLGVTTLIFSSALWCLTGWAGDGHDHKNEKKSASKKTEVKKKPIPKSHKHDEGEKKHDESEEHGKEDSHGHEKKDGEAAHGHEEEGEVEAKNVGPEKGITSFDEDAGFKMSAEALKTFSVEKIKISGDGPWTVPASALLITGEVKSVYRVRDDTFKRIEVTVLTRSKTEVVVRAGEISSGDNIVTKGVGDIRVAEVDVTSGESGHSH